MSMARPGDWWGAAESMLADEALRGLVARPIEARDLAFLRALYAETRAGEMSASGWPQDQVQQFLAMQFDLQHRYYQEHHAGADFLVLLREGQPVGRIYWREQGDEACLIDISLVSAERGRGIGTAFMRLLTTRADARGQDIVLHVEPFNPALRLYRRFGFEALGDNGIYAKLRRRTSQPAVLNG
jgi:ribosomal protein S18 acetylase RimI-like enzyme